MAIRMSKEVSETYKRQVQLSWNKFLSEISRELWSRDVISV